MYYFFTAVQWGGIAWIPQKVKYIPNEGSTYYRIWANTSQISITYQHNSITQYQVAQVHKYKVAKVRKHIPSHVFNQKKKTMCLLEAHFKNVPPGGTLILNSKKVKIQFSFFWNLIVDFFGFSFFWNLIVTVNSKKIYYKIPKK